jgi:hypothetical protein
VSPPALPSLAMPTRRPLLLLLAPLLLSACRLRTTYDSATTATCTREATTGTTNPELIRTRFDDCCHRHGLDSVEPGSQECGHLGLDALMK